MKHKKWTYVRKAWTVAAAFALLGAFLWSQNKWLCVTRITVQADVREGMRIVHLSDHHGAWFGLRQQWLGAAVDAQQPDVIVMTGDFIDARVDERASGVLLNLLTQIAPVYCVTGNHEYYEKVDGRAAYDGLLAAMEQSGAILLRGETVHLTDEISLTGADDPDFLLDMEEPPEHADYIKTLGQGLQGYSILLMHRPELFDDAAEAGFDLTLSGHAHGGQIRLPFVGGLYAHNQGFLPKYTAGLYTHESGAQMIVNRGLGSSSFPQRIFNRPEVTVIDIGPQASAK